jgi:hypothetical protein
LLQWYPLLVRDVKRFHFQPGKTCTLRVLYFRKYYSSWYPLGDWKIETKTMEKQRGSHEEMKERVTSLRAVLSTTANVDFSKLFDEFVEHDEWGLALHVVCDYFLEPTSQAAPATVIQQIQILHEAMKIKDTCVADLGAKAGQQVG